jgi:hypothetical protein
VTWKPSDCALFKIALAMTDSWDETELPAIKFGVTF